MTVASANPAETALVDATLEARFLRWKIKSLFAWLQNFRWLVTRYERHVENFLGFAQLACIAILSRQFVRQLPRRKTYSTTSRSR